jgi:hypothetical protein
MLTGSERGQYEVCVAAGSGKGGLRRLADCPSWGPQPKCCGMNASVPQMHVLDALPQGEVFGWGLWEVIRPWSGAVMSGTLDL